MWLALGEVSLNWTGEGFGPFLLIIIFEDGIWGNTSKNEG
ncbi:MAG: hypothetical protein RLZZ568_2354 [Cyanobacteriota bacterium]|jgi:hypothetical protein